MLHLWKWSFKESFFWDCFYSPSRQKVSPSSDLPRVNGCSHQEKDLFTVADFGISFSFTSQSVLEKEVHWNEGHNINYLKAIWLLFSPLSYKKKKNFKIQRTKWNRFNLVSSKMVTLHRIHFKINVYNFCLHHIFGKTLQTGARKII